MDEVQPRGCAPSASRKNDDAAALGVAQVLGLAAAPTFVIMALLTAARDDGPMDTLCVAATHGGSLLSGMTLMYVLMSIFHSPPWLSLFSRRTTQSRT